MTTFLGRIIFDTNWIQSSIAKLVIHETQFEINLAMLTWVSKNLQYGDNVDNDPMVFLQRFEQICSTVGYSGVSEEAIKLLLIPFALEGQVRE